MHLLCAGDDFAEEGRVGSNPRIPPVAVSVFVSEVAFPEGFLLCRMRHDVSLCSCVLMQNVKLTLGPGRRWARGFNARLGDANLGTPLSKTPHTRTKPYVPAVYDTVQRDEREEPPDIKPKRKDREQEH
jgi:hypothetical protein